MEPAAIDEMFRIESEHWWFVGKRLVTAALLAERLERGAALRVLDVGCGTGGVLGGLGPRSHAVGVDRSPAALAYCRRRGLVHLACADGGQLPFGPGTFDVVLLLDVLEHYADEGALLADVRRLLAPGGMLLVSVPAFGFLWSAHDEVLHHVRRYTARRLQRVLEAAGFAVTRLTYTNVAAFPPALVVRGVLQRAGLLRARATDFRLTNRWLNRALVTPYQLEARALRRFARLPIGLSVAALAAPRPAD
jgi:SAM-dependent methyltransferase